MANGYIGQVRIGSNDYKIGSTLYAVCSGTGQNGCCTFKNQTGIR